MMLIEPRCTLVNVHLMVSPASSLKVALPVAEVARARVGAVLVVADDRPEVERRGRVGFGRGVGPRQEAADDDLAVVLERARARHR